MIKANKKNKTKKSIIAFSILLGAMLSSCAHEPLRGVDLSQPVEVDGWSFKQEGQVILEGDLFHNLQKEPESKDFAKNAGTSLQIGSYLLFPSTLFMLYGFSHWLHGGSSTLAIIGSSVVGAGILMMSHGMSEGRRAVELHNKRFEQKSQITPFVGFTDSAGSAGLSLKF